MQRWFLGFVLAGAAAAQGLPSQLELGGFQLGQYLRTAGATFGAPRVSKGLDGGWLLRAYSLVSSPEVNLVLQCPPGEPPQIDSIMVSGVPASRYPLPGGLELGLSEQAVTKVLGPPKTRKVYQDRGDTFVRLEFAHRNYACEFDAKGHMVSFMIFGFEGFPAKPADRPSLAPLERALDGGDLRDLASVLAPDFEIYHRGETLTYTQSAALDLAGNLRLREALIGPGGLKAALARADARAVFQSRPSGDGGPDRPQATFAFPDSPVLESITFVFQAGAWKVYEVMFRDAMEGVQGQ